MRRLALCLTLGATMLWAAPAEANGWNSLRAGVQGLIQFPADPVMFVIAPPDEFVDELPAGQVTGRILGVVAGTAMAGYRVLMGATDIVLSPLWVFPTLSPEANWNWFDVEYEDL
jgi:hypothetical protein